MNGLEDLLRDVLHADAENSYVPTNLAERSAAAGRRLRRSRRLTLGSVCLVAATGFVATSIAIGGPHVRDDQVVVPSASRQDGPTFGSWGIGRVYGHSPNQTFFAGLGGTTKLAFGELPDGTDFVLMNNAPATPVPTFLEGWKGQSFGGLAAGDGTRLKPPLDYLSIAVPTRQSVTAQHVTSRWLIIVASPGTTAAAYAPDGHSWQPMDVSRGIAVLKIGQSVPPQARIRLAESSGANHVGRLVVPNDDDLALPAANFFGHPVIVGQSTTLGGDADRPRP